MTKQACKRIKQKDYKLRERKRENEIRKREKGLLL